MTPLRWLQGMQGEKTSLRLASIADATHKCLPSAESATVPNAGHGMHLMRVLKRYSSRFYRGEQFDNSFVILGNEREKPFVIKIRW